MSGSEQGATTPDAAAETTATVAEAPAPAAPAAVPAVSGDAAAQGESVYKKSCVNCHGMGVAGAPKLGDKAAWDARAAKGVDALLQSATKGLNLMPPRGACPNCTDDELKAGIEYMLQQVQ
jgi:cytochrome c5